ncbi:putative chitin binding protein [Fusarium austroafricanum]|uniref:Putative chitin binding protein n=1 Tax=Fusarium austroafricanum TaxID=2364996 RepID=A0A8H4PBK8_9HYPO|nr:putative chitin binding protein [Fusarium austroafricanum]
MSSSTFLHRGIVFLLTTALIIFYLEGAFPRKTIPQTPLRMHQRCIAPRTVALTYDDNPNEKIYDLLALLKRYNATATFFPNAPYHFEMWKKLDKYIYAAHAAGHQIALHTWDHIRLDDVTPQKAIENIFLRPPYGACKDDCMKMLTSNGYTVAEWALDTYDWKFKADDQAESSLDIINKWKSKETRVGEDDYAGPIVLMHAWVNTSITVITPALLEFFTAKHFRLAQDFLKLF